MELQEVVRHFEKPTRLRDGSYKVLCSSHRDKKQSLHITKKNNKILMCCQAGCKTEDILAAVGLQKSDLFLDQKEKRSRTWKDRMEYGFQNKYGAGAHIVDVYDYTDEEGNYQFSKIRIEGGSIEGKEFIQARIDEINDSYQYGLSGVQPVLYNLPALIRCISEGFPVYIVEGEKDVKTLQSKLHYTATTAGSVSGWKKDFAKYFLGATVNILPDNDTAGEKMMEEIKRDLKQYAFMVRVVRVRRLSRILKGYLHRGFI